MPSPEHAAAIGALNKEMRRDLDSMGHGLSDAIIDYPGGSTRPQNGKGKDADIPPKSPNPVLANSKPTRKCKRASTGGQPVQLPPLDHKFTGLVCHVNGNTVLLIVKKSPRTWKRCC
ncbi:hypothetical protein N7519_008452 [Penicillium mononematosum]|uniref:uncharacterized protein n=1 Tax=Penicillium mononematosum TaxID=268346 RepID=UPI002547EEBB|nr:uncharacterized protein N7519_008452 [Penicillium mononematosum]KAJ6177991.1 hypothetical protein N7519_008452 [Penicillium mononematosum]